MTMKPELFDRTSDKEFSELMVIASQTEQIETHETSVRVVSAVTPLATRQRLQFQGANYKPRCNYCTMKRL